MTVWDNIAYGLADAHVDVIAWNGTSAGWLGLDRDVHLCHQITQRTGILATSSLLALRELLRIYGIERCALVTPYTTNVQDLIIENLKQEGVTCVAEAHSGIISGSKLVDKIDFQDQLKRISEDEINGEMGGAGLRADRILPPALQLIDG